MLLCVFGLTNQVWVFLEIDAEHVCLFDFFLGYIERKVWFEKSGLNSCVFGKHLISYSCIFLIKFNALRGGCTEIGVFFKKFIFPEFRSIEAYFRPIENVSISVQKFLVDSIDPHCFWINRSYFRPIECNFRSIENRAGTF